MESGEGGRWGGEGMKRREVGSGRSRGCGGRSGRWEVVIGEKEVWWLKWEDVRREGCVGKVSVWDIGERREGYSSSPKSRGPRVLRRTMGCEILRAWERRWLPGGEEGASMVNYCPPPGRPKWNLLLETDGEGLGKEAAQSK